MHIVMLSDVEAQGGAAMAAGRLAEALCQMGHRVTRLVAWADGRQHLWSTHGFDPPGSMARRVVRRLLPTPARVAWDTQVAGRYLRRALASLRPDVINVHNLHGAAMRGWSPELLRICRDHAPTVWTLHDMWSFTGRCAYSYDCTKFLIGCDVTCPTPTEYPALSPRYIGPAWEKRRRLLASLLDLVAITPSRWLAKEAQEGLWAGHRVDVIPNGLPLGAYVPLDRSLAREALGITGPRPILLVMAQNWSERRKGGGLLQEALSYLSHRPFTLVTMGTGGSQLVTGLGSQCVLGYIDHERTRVLAFNAADLFVHPAPVDNLPNVVMESIACGTPVVGFPTGGVAEMVRPGQTGWLASTISAEELAKTIVRALDDSSDPASMRQSCRAIAEAEYGVGVQAQRYLQLYGELLVSVGAS